MKRLQEEKDNQIRSKMKNDKKVNIIYDHEG